MTTTTATQSDVLRSRVAARAAERLPEHLERMAWDASRLAEHQRDRLRALLGHAMERSPFHARRLAGIDPARFELADLAHLPTMTKAQMMEGFDQLVTDPRLNRNVVEQHLARCAHVPSLLLGDYVCLASGGSSGVRGVFVQTANEYVEFSASIMRRAIARAAAAGPLPPGGVTIGLVAAASPIHSTGFGATTIRGPVNLAAVPVTLPLAEIVDRLNALAPPILMGYPSKLAQLAREKQAGRLRIAPSSITATSEMLLAEDRAAITAAFAVPVIDQFASTEGLVGHSDPDGSVLTFASDTCLAELVDAHGQPVGPGRACAKVLVTNLHNFTQPLIRYELGDRFIRHPGEGHLRAAVDGRCDDVFRYGDVDLHPLVIRTEMVKAAAVSEYQVRQTERGLDVAVVADGPLDAAALAAALEAGMRTAGIGDARVAVRVVDAIPRHPQTGKVPRFIPLASR